MGLRDRLRSLRRWLQWRTLFVVLSAIALLLGIYTLLVIARQDYGAGQTVRLSIVWAILGMTWAATGIVSNVLTIRTAASQKRPSKRNLVAPNLTPSDPVVDRTVESKAFVAALLSNQVVNLHGRKGTGKSHFLGFIADCVNGHREIDETHTSLKALKKYQCVYVDVSEALGFDDVLQQIFETRFPSQSPSWSQLIANFDEAFSSSPVIFIIDNVNARGVWGPIGRALYAYLAQRPDDKVVLGSIQAIRFHNLSLKRLEFDAFDRQAISELAQSSGIELTDHELGQLESTTDGLPLFLRLLFTHWDQRTDAPPGTSAGVRLFLQDAILPKLDSQSVELLATIALAAVADPEIDAERLQSLPIDASAAQIEKLRAFSLVIQRERGGRTFLKTHDLIRDAVVENCADEVEALSGSLAKAALRRGNDRRAALYSLYGGPDTLSSEDTVGLVRETVLTAVRSRDFPLLATISLIWQSRSAVKQATLDDDALNEALLLGRATAFAGVGDYRSAVSILDEGATPVFRKLSSDVKLNPLEYEIAILHADLIHLQNRYDEALDELAMLQARLIEANDDERLGKVEWMIGHVLRHQGADLDAALRQFDHAQKIARGTGDVATELASITGRCTIQILRGDDTDSIGSELRELSKNIEQSSGDQAFLVKAWKSMSQIAFASGQTDEATKLLSQAISVALENNDRLLFNYYFERAEYARLSGDPIASVDDYQLVLEFGRENGDRNLIANALLGLAEAEISVGRPIHHKSHEDIRGGILQARAIAQDADIQLTAKQAEMTLHRFETGSGSQGRLLLF